MTNRSDCSDSGTKTTAPVAAAAVVVVVASAAATPPPLRTRAAAPRGLSTTTPGLTPSRCGQVLGGSASNSLPYRPCWSTFPYDLPPQQVSPTFTPPIPPPPLAALTPWMSSRHQQPLVHSFHTMTMVPPVVIDWVVDSGTSNHTTFSAANLTSVRSPLPTNPLFRLPQ
jgi:hypothetical protein